MRGDRPEHAGAVCGVPGRFYAVVCASNGRILNQTFISEWRCIGKMRIRATLRFDDKCGNGHEYFSITGETQEFRDDIKAWRNATCGCIHEALAEHLPELSPLLPWHLCSTDGPMYYLANTIYHAGDRDHNGLLKGESRQIRNGKSGLPAWQLVAVAPDGAEVEVHSLEKYCDAESKPSCIYRLEYRPWCIVGEGKERELDAARRCAIWPEATDAELTAPGLRERLEARLPGLLQRFRGAMVAAGFSWPERED